VIKLTLGLLESTMRAHEVMTRDVVSILPDATVREIVDLLLDRQISAVPVIDQACALVGIVSEGDLLRRRELGTDKRRHGWRAFLANPDTVARDYVKSRGLHARDIMSAPVISVGPDATLAELAEVMEKRGIKRVPVVESGRLVGLVRVPISSALWCKRPPGQRCTRTMRRSATPCCSDSTASGSRPAR
jgi:CBS domain-containing protein